MPEIIGAAPVVQDRLRRWLAVDVKENGIAFVGIEVRRLDDPAVQLDAVADVHAEELR